MRYKFVLIMHLNCSMFFNLVALNSPNFDLFRLFRRLPFKLG